MKFILLFLSTVLSFTSVISFSQGTMTELPATVPNILFSIHFSDADHGYMTTSNHHIYKTSDGGGSWTDVSPAFTELYPWNYYVDIYTVSSEIAFTAGGGPNFHILRTLNGGATWDTISINHNVVELYFIDENIGLAHGNDLYRTTDGGMTWSEISFPYSGGRGVEFINSQVGFMPKLPSGLLKTTDAGLTWTEVTVPMTQWIRDIDFRDELVGLVVCNNGEWARTEDGGATWVISAYSTPYQFTGVQFINDTHAIKIISNVGNTIYHSYDAGLTWVQAGSFSCSGMMDLSFTSDCIGYIGAANGQLVKYEDDICLLDNEDIQMADLTCFPNPVNGNTLNIETAESNLWYTIVDNSGRLILESELIYDEIDVSALSAGIYFVTFQNDHFYKVHKIVVE